MDVVDLGDEKCLLAVRDKSILRGFCDWFNYDCEKPILATYVKSFSESKLGLWEDSSLTDRLLYIMVRVRGSNVKEAVKTITGGAIHFVNT